MFKKLCLFILSFLTVILYSSIPVIKTYAQAEKTANNENTMTFWNWLVYNKEWVFSGIGVLVLSLFISLFGYWAKRYWAKRKQKPRKNDIHQDAEAGTYSNIQQGRSIVNNASREFRPNDLNKKSDEDKTIQKAKSGDNSRITQAEDDIINFEKQDN